MQTQALIECIGGFYAQSTVNCFHFESDVWYLSKNFEISVSTYELFIMIHIDSLIHSV